MNYVRSQNSHEFLSPHPQGHLETMAMWTAPTFSHGRPTSPSRAASTSVTSSALTSETAAREPGVRNGPVGHVQTMTVSESVFALAGFLNGNRLAR